MIKIFMAVAATVLIASSGCGGFIIGEYYSNQKMERIALAHSCGYIDAPTLKFHWMVQRDVGIVIDALPTKILKKKNSKK